MGRFCFFNAALSCLSCSSISSLTRLACSSSCSLCVRCSSVSSGGGARARARGSTSDAAPMAGKGSVKRGGGVGG